jgi:hypothetical protein
MVILHNNVVVSSQQKRNSEFMIAEVEQVNKENFTYTVFYSTTALL